MTALRSRKAIVHDKDLLPRSLPEHLPEGGRILWQGAPDWRVLARTAFHARGLAIYFAAIIAICVALRIADGMAPADVALLAAQLADVGAVPIAFLTLYSWMTQKATVYTVTTHRVAIRLGLVVPVTINLPYRKIESAAFKPYSNGFGDIPLLLNASDRPAYLLAWPHARPWRMARAEPMLRAIPDAARVGQVLARALAASADMPAPTGPTVGSVVGAAGETKGETTAEVGLRSAVPA